jgi:hypothetical protein
MNVPRLQWFSFVLTDRMVAALHSAFLQPVSLRAPMKSADSLLIPSTS